MIVGVVDETTSSESRVAASPASVTQLTKLGYQVQVQAGAGSKAYFSDQAYRDAGASIIVDRSAVIASSDILIRLLPPSSEDIASLRPEALGLALFGPVVIWIWYLAPGKERFDHRDGLHPSNLAGSKNGCT